MRSRPTTPLVHIHVNSAGFNSLIENAESTKLSATKCTSFHIHQVKSEKSQVFAFNKQIMFVDSYEMISLLGNTATTGEGKGREEKGRVHLNNGVPNITMVYQ